MRLPSNAVVHTDATVLARRRVVAGMGAVGVLALAGTTLFTWTPAETQSNALATEPVSDQAIDEADDEECSVTDCEPASEVAPGATEFARVDATGGIVTGTGVVVVTAATGAVAIGVAGG